MFLRLFLLLSLIGQLGPDASGVADSREYNPAGRKFGYVLSLLVLIGAVILAALVVIAILALNGHFENSIIDPAV